MCRPAAAAAACPLLPGSLGGHGSRTRCCARICQQPKRPFPKDQAANFTKKLCNRCTAEKQPDEPLPRVTGSADGAPTTTRSLRIPVQCPPRGTSLSRGDQLRTGSLGCWSRVPVLVGHRVATRCWTGQQVGSGPPTSEAKMASSRAGLFPQLSLRRPGPHRLSVSNPPKSANADGKHREPRDVRSQPQDSSHWSPAHHPNLHVHPNSRPAGLGVERPWGRRSGCRPLTCCAALSASTANSTDRPFSACLRDPHVLLCRAAQEGSGVVSDPSALRGLGQQRRHSGPRS